jgi:type III restriction enzyme
VIAASLKRESHCAPEKTLHIDSKVLDKAESREEAPEMVAANGEADEGEENENDTPKRKLSKKDQGELLRRMVDTVGKVGAEGEQIQNVISVGMLSEGWDAKTRLAVFGCDN